MNRHVLALLAAAALSACTTARTGDTTPGAAEPAKTGIETGTTPGVQRSGDAIPVDD